MLEMSYCLQKTHCWSLNNNSNGVVFKFILFKFRMDKIYSICDTHAIIVIIIIVWNSLWIRASETIKTNHINHEEKKPSLNKRTDTSILRWWLWWYFSGVWVYSWINTFWHRHKHFIQQQNHELHLQAFNSKSIPRWLEDELAQLHF